MMDSNVEGEREDIPEIIGKGDDIPVTHDDDKNEMKPEENDDHRISERNDEGVFDEAPLEDTQRAVENHDMGDDEERNGLIEDTGDAGDGSENDDRNSDNATLDLKDKKLDGDKHRGDDRGESNTACDDDGTIATKNDSGEDTQQRAASNDKGETQNDNHFSGEEDGADEVGPGGVGGERLEGDGDQELEDGEAKGADEDDFGDSVSVRTSKTTFAVDAEINDSNNNADIKESPVEQGDDEAHMQPKSVSKSSLGKKSSVGKKSKTVRVRSSKTVSSIEVDMSRIMRSTRGRGDVDSDDDDDAVTRVTTCTKSVDFSLPVDDEVEDELQRVIERPGSGRTSMMEDEELAVGRAATMNTPVTNDDRESYMYARSIRTPSRDGIYEHALNLINNRCRGTGGSVYSSRSQPHSQRRRQSDPPPRSASSLPATLIGGVPMFDLPNVVEHINQEPFVQQPNSYFYIAQERPLPMKPLKVWKGYRGNVYFEPMVCRKIRMSTPPDPETGTNERQSDKTAKEASRFPSIAKSKGTLETDTTRTPSKSATTTRSQMFITQMGHEKNTRGTKSAMSTRSGNPRQLAILDKGSVLDRMDYNTAEDIRWISGIESTGTLQIGASNTGVTGRAYRYYRSGPKHPKLRIRRGLVSHELATGNKHAPKLGVRGGHINEKGNVISQRKPAAGGDHASLARGTGARQDHRVVSQSHPSDKYSCVDPMTALREIMNRNDGHGRSKLVHILPSATNYSNSALTTPMIREKGK